MPWTERTRERARLSFTADVERGYYSMTELCARHGVSRKTGYKWADRYCREGIEGLQDRSRAPKSCPHRTPDWIVEEIVEGRRLHPTWGAKKLLWLLQRRFPERERWPSRTTITNVLERHGLTQKKKRVRRSEHPGRPLVDPVSPNEVWAADFKGQFRTQDRRWLYPLTVTDSYSRYLLECRGVPSTAHHIAKPVFERLFREFGLPGAILTDNGVPFSSVGLGRLSRLSVWWIRQGIVPILIEPGHPEQNGRHERMHRTLKVEATTPPKGNRSAQQRELNRFRREYNEERPHEGLGMQLPADLYQPSPTEYRSRLPRVEYPEHFEVRKVSSGGGIKWNDEYLYVGQALGGEYVGFQAVDEGIWAIYFSFMPLGYFDQIQWRIDPC